MKPRFDLIQSRFIRPEDETFALDIASIIRKLSLSPFIAEVYLQGDARETFKYHSTLHSS